MSSNYKYFKSVDNIEDAKALYRRLVMKWHPDVSSESDATRVMAEINAEWEKVFAALKDVHKRNDGSTYTETLKSLGFQWAAKKRMWNFHKEPWTRHGKKEIPMDAIKAKYGCTRFENEPLLKLA